MPTIFEARMDGSEAIRYFHVPMVGFYLSSAFEYATSLSQTDDPILKLRNTISTITFSAMTLEAFINEVSENEIRSDLRDEFDRGQKKYKKPQGQSSIRFKFCRLLLDKHQFEAPLEFADKLELLANLRNTLVHYKLSETAGKAIMEPVTKTVLRDGEAMFTIDFTKPPRRVEPPFLDKISPEAGLKSYSIAIDALKIWLELEGDIEQLKLLDTLAIPSSAEFHE